jgi:hypothetical protein
MQTLAAASSSSASRGQGAASRAGSAPCILLKAGERAFFVRGFAKNELDNIRDDELAAFKLLAAQMLAYDDAALALALVEGILMEVAGDGEAIP